MSSDISLDDLRREIDAIDNNIHDLIMRRTQVVEQVREAKRGQTVKIRPARECSILYRLMERHKGPFPKRELARIWRELIAATLSFEGPFSIAVHTPEESDGERHDRRWSLARDQYGSFTPATGYTSARRLIDAIRTQRESVGVLGVPGRNEASPWWPHLVSRAPDTPRIMNRLPFIGAPKDRTAEDQALVICPIVSEPTGRDRTYLAVESDDELSLDRLSTALRNTGMEPVFTTSWRDPEAPSRYLCLAEVEGFVSDEDRKILRLGEALEGAAASIMTIGGYGLPLSLEELETTKPTETEAS